MVKRKMTRTKVEILLKHVLPVYSLAQIGVGTDPMIPGFLNVKIDFWLQKTAPLMEMSGSASDLL
jgi:hypothetical protein